MTDRPRRLAAAVVIVVSVASAGDVPTHHRLSSRRRLFPGAADLEPVVHAQDAADMGKLLRLLLFARRIDGSFQDSDAVVDVDVDVIVPEAGRLVELGPDLLLLFVVLVF